MYERLGSALPENTSERHRFRRVLFHVIKAAMPKNIVPPGFIDRDLEEVREMSNLSGQVFFEIFKMKQENIGKAPNVPPRLNVLPKRPERITITVQPVVEINLDRSWRRLDWWSNAVRRVVYRLVPLGIGVCMVVVQAPNDVTPVAADI